MKIIFALLSVSAVAQTYDLVISGGRIIDGSGNAGFYGDIAVKGDRSPALHSGGRVNTRLKDIYVRDLSRR